MPDKPFIHVVAAVIRGDDGRVLLGLRPPGSPHGGLWEFPGGKLEPGERRLDGLARELREELGIEVRSATPLIQVPHEYDETRVLLDAWEIDDWIGQPSGLEGQDLKWAHPRELHEYRFPAANKTVVRACHLPRLQLVTPEPEGDDDRFIENLAIRLAAGITLVQLRAKSYDAERYAALARRVLATCHDHGARLLLNTDAVTAETLGADGVQLSAARLTHMHERPLASGRLVGASCHNPDELRCAEGLDVDFAMLSPVLHTRSHPGVGPLGWDALRALMQTTALPVYALGGMEIEHLDRAVRTGCVGIAMIRGLWHEPARNQLAPRIDAAIRGIRQFA